MMKRHLDPARSIVAKLGVDVIAAASCVHVSRVYRWMSPKSRGGTGGFIPINHIRPIISAAADRGIYLSADDFIPQTLTRPRKEARAEA